MLAAATAMAMAAATAASAACAVQPWPGAWWRPASLAAGPGACKLGMAGPPGRAHGTQEGCAGCLPLQLLLAVRPCSLSMHGPVPSTRGALGGAGRGIMPGWPAHAGAFLTPWLTHVSRHASSRVSPCSNWPGARRSTGFTGWWRRRPGDPCRRWIPRNDRTESRILADVRRAHAGLD